MSCCLRLLLYPDPAEDTAGLGVEWDIHRSCGERTWVGKSGEWSNTESYLGALSLSTEDDNKSLLGVSPPRGSPCVSLICFSMPAATLVI